MENQKIVERLTEIMKEVSDISNEIGTSIMLVAMANNAETHVYVGEYEIVKDGAIIEFLQKKLVKENVKPNQMILKENEKS